MSLDKQNQQIIAYVFLGLMVIFLILAVTTFEGTPTILLIISALVFLTVGLVMLSGGESSGTSSGSSQQQSVVLGGGRVITQGGDDVLRMCGGCNARVPENAKFCPQCGHSA